MPSDGACPIALALPKPLNGALEDTVQGQLYGPPRRGPAFDQSVSLGACQSSIW